MIIALTLARVASSMLRKRIYSTSKSVSATAEQVDLGLPCMIGGSGEQEHSPSHHRPHEARCQTTWHPTCWPRSRSALASPRPLPSSNPRGAVPAGFPFLDWHPVLSHRCPEIRSRSPSQSGDVPATRAKHPGSRLHQAAAHRGSSRRRMWSGYNPATRLPARLS